MNYIGLNIKYCEILFNYLDRPPSNFTSCSIFPECLGYFIDFGHKVIVKSVFTEKITSPGNKCFESI